MIKGYFVSEGYMGYVDGEYQLFADERDYVEYIEDYPFRFLTLAYGLIHRDYNTDGAAMKICKVIHEFVYHG